jgi:hypothetical protein
LVQRDGRAGSGEEERTAVTRTEEQVASSIANGEDSLVLKMTATGNPDFVVIPRALVNKVRFVEVKSGTDKVHSHQQAVHENLRWEGFRVDVVRVQEGKSAIEPPPPSKRCLECGEELCECCGECPNEGPCACAVEFEKYLRDSDPEDYEGMLAERSGGPTREDKAELELLKKYAVAFDQKSLNVRNLNGAEACA